jgi:hypothetical protein
MKLMTFLERRIRRRPPTPSQDLEMDIQRAIRSAEQAVSRVESMHREVTRNIPEDLAKGRYRWDQR